VPPADHTALTAAAAHATASPDTAPPDTAPAVPPPLHPPAPLLPRRVRVAAGLCALATAAAWGIHLGRPGVLVFDEAYYAVNAWEIADNGVEIGNVVHPPLAKWLIAGGMRLFGFTPFGWRIVPLLAGALTVGLAVCAAFVLTRSLRLALLAALIIATDGVAVVSARTALLDSVLAGIVAAIVCLLVVITAHPLRERVVRLAIPACAVLCGCALATKWSAAPLWLVACAAVGASTAAAGRDPLRRTMVMIVAPLLVYAAAFAPTLVAYRGSGVQRVACAGQPACDTSLTARVDGVIDWHTRVLRYHRNLKPTNRYATSSWHWITQTRPTVLFDSGQAAGGAGDRIVMRANPAIWVVGFASVAGALVTGALRRNRTVLTISAAALLWWLPWAVGSRPGYSFYAAPMVAPMALCVVWAVGRFRWPSRIGAVVALTAVAGVPLLAADWVAW
jgi:dolichyl-phosphate-mannose-protein mannosyltransferase